MSVIHILNRNNMSLSLRFIFFLLDHIYCFTVQVNGKKENNSLGDADSDFRAQFGRKKRYLIKIAISECKTKIKAGTLSRPETNKELAEMHSAAGPHW